MKMVFDREGLLYGGDYNPEQWLEYPEILEKDIAYMKKAHINTVTMGIFAWSSLEPEEGKYDFSWMEERIRTLYENGISVILATPSGSRPKWLADNYPEVRRVNAERQRELYGFRHNHCYTSPAYRAKVREIDAGLARRFGSHPGVIGWHFSNEFGGECHCPLCQQAFQVWLKEKYGTIGDLNRKWMTTFWSHTYQNFEQIESPSPIGEPFLHALNLDWKRFVTHQTMDFAKWEIESLRLCGARQPVTTNMMTDFEGLNYYKFADVVDFVSWDSYPDWHEGDDREAALDTAMQHDIMRCIKNQPFYLLESCPSGTNWQKISKLKTPGLLEAASLQALAHGSESVLYFQIRQSRGSFEKFHGAVIDHYGGTDTRVFRETQQIGAVMESLSEIQGSRTKAQAAVLYDWENRWAVNDAAGVRNLDKKYKEAVNKSYRGFRRQGINVDVIDMERPLDGYRIVAAPMLYLFREGIEKKLRDFVAGGGTLVMTYWSGIVDDTDLCFLGGTPHGLMDVMGLRSEEIDALFDGETNIAAPSQKNPMGFTRTYRCENYSDLVRTGSAETLLVYENHFYADRPALTVNTFEKGKAYYICADMEQDFYDDFYGKLVKGCKVEPVLSGWEQQSGLLAASRESEEAVYIFLQNFSRDSVPMPSLDADMEVLYGERSQKNGSIDAYGTVVLKKKRGRKEEFSYNGICN